MSRISQEGCFGYCLFFFLTVMLIINLHLSLQVPSSAEHFKLPMFIIEMQKSLRIHSILSPHVKKSYSSQFDKVLAI